MANPFQALMSRAPILNRATQLQEKSGVFRSASISIGPYHLADVTIPLHGITRVVSFLIAKFVTPRGTFWNSQQALRGKVQYLDSDMRSYVRVRVINETGTVVTGYATMEMHYQ